MKDQFKIVADSCCDLTPELQSRLGVETVPLTLRLGEENFVDDHSLDVGDYVEKMSAYSGVGRSACPSPEMYREKFMGGAFAVTLSSNLSGSNASALLGKAMAEEEGEEGIHVIDSKSASAGELLVTLKLRELIDKGLEKTHIVEQIQQFVNSMKTYFVLENLENLIKNGRMSKIKGRLCTALGIRPILGSDGDGNIAHFTQARGPRQIIDKLVSLIDHSGKETKGEKLVIAHCNNEPMAHKLRDAVRDFKFSEVFVVPTRGLSSMYANDKGLILAF